MKLKKMVEELQNYLSMYGDIDVECAMEADDGLYTTGILGFDLCETECGIYFLHVNIEANDDMFEMGEDDNIMGGEDGI